jgi:hypothetical protein
MPSSSLVAGGQDVESSISKEKKRRSEELYDHEKEGV